MSNMYDDYVTWNPLGGECSHKCTYCFVERQKRRFTAHREKYSGPPRLWKSEFCGDPAGAKRPYRVFVCSCNDLFAEEVVSWMILEILVYCNKYPENEYLFQSKNPERFRDFFSFFPPKAVFATTIETDQPIPQSKAPHPTIRLCAMKKIVEDYCDGITWKTQITTEPIISFSPQLTRWIIGVRPDVVYVGANTSKDVLLPEPRWGEVVRLVEDLREAGVTVIEKGNLDRLRRNTR